jgi:hypothetical protein
MEARRLRDLASIIAGSNPEHSHEATPAEGLPLLSLKDVNQTLTPVPELLEVSVAAARVKRFQLRQGDVVVTTRGSTVRAAVVEPTHAGVIAGANLAIVRPDGSLPPLLLAALLREPGVQATLLGRTAGAVTPGFTIKALGDLEILVPSSERQGQLVEFLAAAGAYRKQMERALELRQLACDAVISRELFPRSVS